MASVRSRRLTAAVRRDPGAVERSGEQVELDWNTSGEQRLGVGDALVAQRVELHDQDVGRWQAGR